MTSLAPDLARPETVLPLLDLLGVAVFAATGALAAAREKHDWVTFAFFGAITGVGGGTLRDLLIGAPVFWVQDWRYIAACVLAASAIWILGARTWRFRALLWLDALGLAAYGVMGTAKAATYGVTPMICVIMGALTACFGGIVRDVLANQPSILLRRELNITAALLSGTLFAVLTYVGVPTWPAVAVAVVAGFGLRAGALTWGWSLPAFPSAPSR
ncbi:trimeric intracellular cation channel family protein [Brevundimonas vesicularis]|uniref:trimeric intracellular cation channel family protein n=1 Tax=Brevundimonas vesicularis TaxID=41276 RepID=UPI0038D3F70B